MTAGPDRQPGCLVRQAVQLSVSDPLSLRLRVPICEREVCVLGGGVLDPVVGPVIGNRRGCPQANFQYVLKDQT